MRRNADVPWEKIYNFILYCGNVHELNLFSVKILSGLTELCRFDQALFYFLDGNGKVCSHHLMNIDEQWSTMYLGYYSKIEDGRYGLSRVMQEASAKPTINIRAWKQEPSNKFICDYIYPRGLKYSLGFVLFDINGMPRTVFSLDKTKDENFTDKEFTALCLAVPQLNNLHKKFFYPQCRQGIGQVSSKAANLTAREIEITNLLCQGVSPANISKMLHISKSTTYSHIAHIYEKLNVSSRQELLVRLLS